MKRGTKFERLPKPWQLEPERIKTSTVQYWKHGTMITAMMTKETAQELVKGKKAFVITSQAIGALTDDGGYDD